MLLRAFLNFRLIFIAFREIYIHFRELIRKTNKTQTFDLLTLNSAKINKNDNTLFLSPKQKTRLYV